MGYFIYSRIGENEKERIIREFLPKIKALAVSLSYQLPKNVSIDDLIQEGLMGLLSSFENYDPSKGASFSTYALKRIKGAMLDYLRKLDWVPRNLRKKMKELEEAVLILEDKLGKIPDDKELAEYLNMEEGEVRKIRNELVRRQLLSLDSYIFEDDESVHVELVQSNEKSPDVIYEKEELREKLKEAIEQLSERERLVLALYYVEELNFKEIGKILGVSESRISQIHSSVISKLKRLLLSRM
ncbi:MAG: FliA/WhiG family RNA polymerase sigma factor [Thermotoga sp.]|nr:MAG: FliA/WhiG family RNA polymerase sigma factor [Thermotoga sp.]